MGFFENILGTSAQAKLKKIQPLVERVNSFEGEISALSDTQMREYSFRLRDRVISGEQLDDILPEAFALVREAAARTVSMRHFDVQVLGGIVLHQGRIAEMKTGEGKTLVATLPAYLNALAGRGVHIVTVNDYLANRDAQWMGKIHRFLGLSVGVIVHGLTPEQRRQAYACDITYGTNNEFGFDYLRDNMVVYKENMVQRDLYYAIVDEVDSILIDEARTPLIISGQGEQSTDMYHRADKFVKRLKRGPNIEKKTRSELLMNEDQEEEGDFMVDIKARMPRLTQQGLVKAEAYFGVESLADTENTELNHHIIQALKANSVFTRDVDYVIQNGQVIIVDEFTGRLMLGRRFSDGLHQALEAKEGVKVERENKTLATITFQNYFRMYEKLAGMTGTAKTEEDEFTGIYNLDVLEIPTHKQLIRIDNNDQVFMSERGKLKAVVNEIDQIHQTRRPILVGTISVEKSELLSGMLTRRGISHNVLNAKHHEKEAEIVAQAGMLNKVTIATNMAGRGTDILLGGNPDYLAREQMRRLDFDDEIIEEATGHAQTDDEQILNARETYNALLKDYKKQTDAEHERVVELGGLHIIGTQRHESRRIDNQLRGRSGRQGDPGSTRFYISLEDDLMLRFGSDKVQGLLNRLSPDDDIPIELSLITKQIETAQRRVEAHNFDIRKNVLRYDDVMNKQREIIYSERRRVLLGEDLLEYFLEMIKALIEDMVSHYCPKDCYPEEYDYSGLLNEVFATLLMPSEKVFAEDEIENLNTRIISERLVNIAYDRYAAKEQEIAEAGADMRELERVVLLRAVDKHWMEHIDAMDQLKQGIGLRAYGQQDPVSAYTHEGFEMFGAMIEQIKEEAIKTIFSAKVRLSTPLAREQLAKPLDTPPEGAVPAKKSSKTVGRNDQCPCGSGKKYKNCCLKGAN